jgi:ArsR family transcriptional regulator, arsenate/arsenite/antimonite-responsive transcriptional repressor
MVAVSPGDWDVSGMMIRQTAKVFRALSDETRLRMVKLLLGRELCVCEIMQALGISQSRASRNLGVLEEAGLLRSWREGLWVHYALDERWAAGEGGALVEALRQLGHDDPQFRADADGLAAAQRVGPRACEMVRTQECSQGRPNGATTSLRS